MLVTWAVIVTIQVQVKSQKTEDLEWLLKIQFQNSIQDCDKIESNSNYIPWCPYDSINPIGLIQTVHIQYNHNHVYRMEILIKNLVIKVCWVVVIKERFAEQINFQRSFYLVWIQSKPNHSQTKINKRGLLSFLSPVVFVPAQDIFWTIKLWR